MKWLFWFLLLTNIVFFAVMHWGGALVADNGNMQPQQALNAEKIKLQKASSVAPAQAVQASAVQPSVSAVSSAQPTVPALSPAQSSVQGAIGAICMEWGEFSGNDLARAGASLSALHLNGRVTQRQTEHASGYWVYIPPQKGRAEVDKKIAQLKARGVEEYFAVKEAGKWQNAISLGIFRTEEAAQKFLSAIESKGVISAKVGERISKLTFTVFELKNLDSGMADKVKALQDAFPGSELKTAACN